MLDYISSVVPVNFPLIYFPHGLFFFAAGIGIMVQHREKSPFRFAKDLWIMGIFALIHAASEWADLVPFLTGYESNQSLYLIKLIPYLIESVSYVFLYIFGLGLLFPEKKRWNIMIAAGVFMFWCGIVGVLLIQMVNPEKIVIHAEALSHYLLLFPSCMITAFGLYQQGKDKGKEKLPPKILSSVHALSVVFLFVAIFNGLIVKQGTFFPANFINTQGFYNIVHFPYQIFRGLIGTALMIVTLKLLRELNIETDRILAQAEKDAMRFSERERIGQDLHDGVIQTLYATGLMLEATVRRLDTESPVREQLNFCINSLNTSILDLRHYITGLRSEDISRKPLKILLENMLSEIKGNDPIQIKFSFIGDDRLHLTANRQNHLYYVVKELLNNICKHTTANQIHLKLTEESTDLTLSLWDNGRGRDDPPKEFWVKPDDSSYQDSGMGLRNIRERVTILRGEIDYSCLQNGGTLVTLHIPKEVS